MCANSLRGGAGIREWACHLHSVWVITYIVSMCANNNGICASKAGNVVGTGTSGISVCVCTIQVGSGVCAREGCRLPTGIRTQ